MQSCYPTSREEFSRIFIPFEVIVSQRLAAYRKFSVSCVWSPSLANKTTPPFGFRDYLCIINGRYDKTFRLADRGYDDGMAGGAVQIFQHQATLFYGLFDCSHLLTAAAVDKAGRVMRWPIGQS